MVDKATRYAMIARAAKKVQKRKRSLRKLMREADRITKYEDPAKSGMHWGDVESYVNDNFGDVYRETTKEEWN